MKDQMGYSYVITHLSPYGHGVLCHSHSAGQRHFVGVFPVINPIFFVNPKTWYFTHRINIFGVLNILFCILSQPSISVAATEIRSKGAQRTFCKWYRIFTWWKITHPPANEIWEPMIKSPNGTCTALSSRDIQKCYATGTYLEVF